MRRLAPLALLLATSLPTAFSLVGCGSGGRDAHDIAADFEGSVGGATAERLARDVDLTRAPVTVSVGTEEPERFGPDDQGALESYLRDAVTAMDGDRVHVTQQVVDDTGGDTQRLTMTLAVEHGGRTRYIPVTLDLARNGRRMIVTSARIMASTL